MMFMNRIKHWMMLALFSGIALLVKANNGRLDNPLLHGYVTDAVTKKPIPGVVVSALLPGVNTIREVKTDSEGYFLFTELPSAQVNLQFEKKGYQQYRKNGLTIKEKNCIRVNVEFQPETDQEDPHDAEYPLLHALKMN
jgi:hypothetical protein